MAKSLEQYKKDQAIAESRIKNNKELLEQIKIDLQQYKVNSPMYNKAKQRAKKLNADIKKYEAEFKIAKEAVDKAIAEQKEVKDKKTAQEAAKNAPALREKAQRAEDAGDTKAAEKYRAKADELEADAKKDYTTKSGTESKTGSQYQLSDTEMVANELSKTNVTLDGSGRPVVQMTNANKLDPVSGKPSVEQVYLYLTTTKGGTGEKAFFFGTSDVIRDRYQKQLIKNYGSKQAVIDKLYKAGYLSTNKEVPTSAYLTALDAAAGEYTVAQVNAYKQEGLKEFPTMDEFLAAKQGTGLGGTKTRTNVTEYSDTAAKKIINAISQQFFGRDANTKELNNLIPLINKELKKNPDFITTTTNAQGDVTRTKTKTGLDVEQFLIDEISQKDEAKANQVLNYYNVFKQSIGVN